MRAVFLPFAVGAVLIGFSANAQDNPKRALAEELLKLMNMQENTKESFAMVKGMMSSQMKKITEAEGHTKMSPEAMKRAEKMNAKMMDVIAEELTWDKLKKDYVDVYAETFSQQELEGAIAYYKSPAGRAFVHKQPQLTKRMMQISMNQMVKIMPKILALTKEMMDETPPPPVKEKEISPPPPPASPPPQ